ncbi:MAG: hypothetical protein Q9188_006606 [Gyalolechia gomerana]
MTALQPFPTCPSEPPRLRDSGFQKFESQPSPDSPSPGKVPVSRRAQKEAETSSEGVQVSQSERTITLVSQVTKRKIDHTDTDQPVRKIHRPDTEPNTDSEHRLSASVTNVTISDKSPQRQDRATHVAASGTVLPDLDVESPGVGASPHATATPKSSESVRHGNRLNSETWNRMEEDVVSQLLRNHNEHASPHSLARSTTYPAPSAQGLPTAPIDSPSPAPDDCSDISLPDIQPPPITTVRRVPINTDAGAASSLEEDQWVSTTAIERLLEKLPKGNAKIYDAAFMKVDKPSEMQDKPSVRAWNKGPSLFPTNHAGRHWTLIVTDPDTANIEFYNSESNPEYEKAAREATKCWTSYLSQSNKSNIDQSKWRFTVQACPSQNNDKDCGISAIVCAIYRILNLFLPQEIDFAMWRLVLHTVLLKSLPDHREQPSDTSGTSATTQSKAISQSSDQDPLQLVDSSSLVNVFDSFCYAHGLARTNYSLATDVQNALDFLLKKLQAELEDAIAQRDKHKAAVLDHISRLDGYKNAVIQHAEVIKALEKSIGVEQKEEANFEKRIQNLQQNTSCWEAGRAVSHMERERQDKEMQSAKAAMEEMIQRFDTVHQRLEDAMKENRRSKLQCIERAAGEGVRYHDRDAPVD